MSRRNTVMIAVLLNAGLLVVLFATSLKSEKMEEAPSAITVLASHTPAPKETPFSAPLSQPAITATPDPIDQVIDKFVTPQVTANFDFLKDLQPKAEAAPAPDVKNVNFKEVTVKKGDVLERIARQHHVTVGDILKASKLTSTRLKIGQVLKIPHASTAAALPPGALSEDHYYTIQPGDNPWMIAVKHHMKVEDLLKLNGMDEQKARHLKAGDKIRIR